MIDIKVLTDKELQNDIKRLREAVKELPLLGTAKFDTLSLDDMDRLLLKLKEKPRARTAGVIK